MSLPESLERAASVLSGLADQIRPANGDPQRLLDELDPEQSVELLSWILNEEPAVAEELIVAWVEADAGAAVLLAMPDEGIAKAGRKLLRKARHRLRSQGLEAVSPKPPMPPMGATRRIGGAPDRWQAAHLSTPDFRGARVGYLVDSHPSGGARLFEIRFDEGRGILDFKIYNAGRSKLRGFLRSLTAGSGQRLFEIERDPLRALVRRASLAQPIDRPLPTSFVEWRSRLFSEEVEKEPTPGDLARLALGSGMGPAASAEDFETTFAEVRDGRLGPWPPKTAWVGDWMSIARASAAGLEGEARGTAIETWLGQVAEALEKETKSELLARHLDELAWIRWQTGALDGARTLLRVSDAVSRDDAAMRRMSRARIEGLFAAFLTELRVVGPSGLDAADAGGRRSEE